MKKKKIENHESRNGGTHVFGTKRFAKRIESIDGNGERARDENKKHEVRQRNDSKSNQLTDRADRPKAFCAINLWFIFRTRYVLPLHFDFAINRQINSR